jgi:RNA 3'-terminal phosphate cyclase (ATP)
MKKPQPIQLDGSQGEGGGQILRSALALSMLRGRAFRIERIRAGRSKPGLMRQHLTCVRAAATVCGARVEGDAIGSAALSFEPGTARAGGYDFKIGSAGSTMLVLQTILPALLTLDAPSTVSFEGGTHTMAAPSTDFIADAFLPLLRRMGAQLSLEVTRHGFFPAGGGQVKIQVTPASLVPLALHERGDPVAIDATAFVRNLPINIAERELDVVRRRLKTADCRVHQLPSDFGPGNALVVRLRHGHVDEVFVGLGVHGVTAEAVAERACDDVHAYLAHGAPVGEHLSDQLLLPMMIARGGSFVTGRPSAHLETNAAVIEAFDAARVTIEPDGSDPQRRYRVTVQSN